MRDICKNIFGNQTPTEENCNGCDKCNACEGIPFLALIIGTVFFLRKFFFFQENLLGIIFFSGKDNPFLKELELTCKFCEGGQEKCKENCMENIEECKLCLE